MENLGVDGNIRNINRLLKEIDVFLTVHHSINLF
jgi:hypothetical protein